MNSTPDPGDTRTQEPSGSSHDQAQDHDGPRVSGEDVRDLSRLRRSVGAERSIGGVAGGLGRHLDIDPVILRVAFVVLAFFGGAGLLLYLACWLVVPAEDAETAPLGLDPRTRSIVLVFAAGLAVLVLLGTSLGDGFVPAPVVVVAAVGAFVVLQLSRRRSPAPTTGAFTDTATVPVAARRRGPVLFWFALATCALGVGLLVTLELAGVAVPPSAYPALVVALSGALLVLGAFWGRGGGLIALGLAATLALAGTVAAQDPAGDSMRITPVSAAQIRADYSVGAGELILDLSEVTDPEALAGRDIYLSAGVGRIEVIVPDDVAAAARASIGGPGRIDLFGDLAGGIGSTLGADNPDASSAADPAEPLEIEASLGLGEIDIHTETSGVTR